MVELGGAAGRVPELRSARSRCRANPRACAAPSPTRRRKGIDLPRDKSEGLSARMENSLL